MWALLSDSLPIYPLYALLFTDSGMSRGQISLLFAIWSAASIVTEVPTGVLADRLSRRGCLSAAGLLQAAGYALWITLPGFPGFATGFALWGVGGSLVSGALQALLYDALADLGAQEHYPRVLGRVSAASLVGQVPAAAAATVLFPLGGYRLVTWVSVACCVAAAALATRLPEAPQPPVATEPDADDDIGYLATLRIGVVEAVGSTAVRRAVLAVAVVTSVDTIDEYFPLMAQDWGVPTTLNPLAVLGIPLLGAAGATLGATASRLRTRTLPALLAAGGALLVAAGLARDPAGLALVAVFYGIYRLVLVVVDVRLQDRIESGSRATVTSVASLLTELAVFGIYASWALGGVLVVAAVVCLTAVALAGLLRTGSG